jgi:hypothetical protein
MEDNEGWEVVDGDSARESGVSAALLSASDIDYFHKTFGLLEETPVHRVLCSVDGSQGWLYVSQRHVCFATAFSFLQRKGSMLLAFRDILDVSSLPSAVVGKTIVLRLDEDRSWSVYVPFGGSVLLEVLSRCWKSKFFFCSHVSVSTFVARLKRSGRTSCGRSREKRYA